MGFGTLCSAELDYSVIVSTRNEGSALRSTIDEVYRHSDPSSLEVVIVDDGSSDDSTSFLLTGEYSERNIRLHRNDSSVGIIQSRAIGARLARGRYLCVLDAHCCVDPGWLHRLAGALASIENRGLAVPVIHSLDERSWSIADDRPGSSGCTIVNPFLDFFWEDARRIDGMSCTCTIGGGAWMAHRDWYTHVGGLDTGMLHWGGENIDLPLRTWLAGGTCLVVEGVRIGHLFKKVSLLRKPAISSSLLTYNKLRAAHSVFSSATLPRIVDNLRELPHFDEAIERIHRNSESLGRLKGHFESVRERSDRWLIESFELPVLEPPFFHQRPRRQRIHSTPARPHPRVMVVVVCSRPERVSRLVASLTERTSYSRCSFLLVSCNCELGRDFRRGPPFTDSNRIHVLSTSSPLAGGVACNMAVCHSETDYLVFVRDDFVVLDDHWVEELVLLFERRTQLLLAAPRVQLIEEGIDAPDESAPAFFDRIWDWDSPGFTHQRREPLFRDPYQALTVPPMCFALHRERFLELGGFDRTVIDGDPPLLDLAIHGWLAGYEVFLDPGLFVGCRPDESTTGNNGTEQWNHYNQMLPAAKYFTNPGRIARSRELSPAAAELLDKNRVFLGRRRQQFLDYCRFDDDWLFCKFERSRS